MMVPPKLFVYASVNDRETIKQDGFPKGKNMYETMEQALLLAPVNVDCYEIKTRGIVRKKLKAHNEGYFYQLPIPADWIVHFVTNR